MSRAQKPLIFTFCLIILLVMLISSVKAQSTSGSVYVSSTANPNVIAITGSGFDSSAQVSLGVYLRDGATLLTVLPDTTTDDAGNFATNVSVPVVGTSGIYIVIANTTNVMGFQPFVFFSPGDAPDTGSGTRSVSISPDNSNIFNVTGKGLGDSKTVTLKLALESGATAYSFPEQTTTDSQGRFSTIVIVPTSLSGTFSLVASTTSGNATVQVTIPNLKGPPGETGQTGATGAAGATGTEGSAAGSSLVYASIALSIAAVVISVYVLAKKH